MIQEYTDRITEEEVTIFGIVDESDVRSAGYNIGDLLNVPSLGGFWKATPHNSAEDLKRMYNVAETYKGSLLQYYVEARPSLEIVPFIPRVRGSITRFLTYASSRIFNYIQRVQDKNTLCIHIRCGDKDVEEEFMNMAKSFSKEYKHVYLFSGLHLDEHFSSNEKKIQNFVGAMNQLLGPNVSLIVADPDIHLCLMSKASNLLVHKGGFSALGVILCNGNIYTTKYMDVMNECWHKKVDQKYTFLYCGED